MKQVKITNGTVYLKEFLSYNLKKEINKAMMTGVEIKSVEADSKKAEMSNLSALSIQEANDVALIGMTEKIVINGEEKPVTMDTYGEMNAEDVERVMREVDKVTNQKSVPLV